MSSPFLQRRSMAISAAFLFSLGGLSRADPGNPSISNVDGNEVPAPFGDGTWLGDEGSWDNDPSPTPPEAGHGDGKDLSEPPPPPAEAEQGDPTPPDETEGQRSGPTIDDFHQALDGDGRWIDTPECGVVWQPTAVDSSFQPYGDGQWSYSSAGWYWNGAEAWSWAVYHYGRWAFINRAWSWIPGRVWGPAWVAWRWGTQYAGWTPIGPRGTIPASPGAWAVIEKSQFLEPTRRQLQPISIARAFVRETQVFPLQHPGPHAGPAVRTVARDTGELLRTMKIRSVRSPGLVSYRSGGAIDAYRPQTRPILATPVARKPVSHRSAVAEPFGGEPTAFGVAPHVSHAKVIEIDRGAQGEPTAAPAFKEPEEPRDNRRGREEQAENQTAAGGFRSNNEVRPSQRFEKRNEVHAEGGRGVAAHSEGQAEPHGEAIARPAAKSIGAPVGRAR